MKIRIVAPSNRIGKGGIDKFNVAVNNLRNKGFSVDVGDLVCRKGKVPSPEEKAHELVCAFVGDADIVWSAAGGDGAIDIVNVLDFAQIGKPLNKLYIGFSDSCSICYALATQCDMPSIYGHNVKGMADIKEDRLDVLDMIAAKNVFLPMIGGRMLKPGL